MADDSGYPLDPTKRPSATRRPSDIFENGDGRGIPDHFDPKLPAPFLKYYQKCITLHQGLKESGSLPILLSDRSDNLTE